MSADTVPTNRNWILVLIILLLVLPLCCMATLCGTFVLGVGTFAGTSDLGDVDVEIDGLGDLSELEALFEGDRESVTDTFEKTFEVDDDVSLIVGIEVGSVKVEVGDDEEIVVEGEVKAYGSTEDEAEDALRRVEVVYDDRRDAVEITANWDEPSGWSITSPKVDMTIKVPERTDIDIEIDVGDVEVRDTVGDLKVNGDVGNVSVRDVLVSKNMELSANVGEIEFRGELQDGAAYNLTTDAGQITVRIPSDSSFEIDASTDVGDVSIDFDVDGTEDRDFTSKTVQGTVGDDDTGTELILHTDVGAINVESR